MNEQKAAFELYNLYLTAKSFLSSKGLPKRRLLKYRGKTSAKYSNFENTVPARYCFLFAKKDIPQKKFLRLCACAYRIKGSKFFIGDLISNEVLEEYKKFQDYIDNFPISYKTDLENNDLNTLIKRGINFPHAFELYSKGKLSLGFILCLERMTQFLESFNKENTMNFGQKILWDSSYTQLKKFDDFLFEDINFTINTFEDKNIQNK